MPDHRSAPLSGAAVQLGWLPFMRGYASQVELEAEERRRAADVFMIRALVDLAFRVCIVLRLPERALLRGLSVWPPSGNISTAAIEYKILKSVGEIADE